MTRILVYGAGAIGGCLGAMLAQAGNDVTLVARGAQRAALETQGSIVDWGDGRRVTARPAVCGPGGAAGPFDYVLVTLKTTHLEDSAPELARLAEHSPLVLLQNGIPWWYFQHSGTRWDGHALRSVDATGTLARLLDVRQLIPAVIYQPVTQLAPGHCHAGVLPSNRILIGEIDDAERERGALLVDVLRHAGLTSETTRDIRTAIWRKLQLNMVWNPLCALTHAAPMHFFDFPGGGDLARALMEEGQRVAAAVGVSLPVDVEGERQRVAGNYRFVPSMAQDARAGRPLEWAAILGAVLEIAELTGTPMPTFRTVALCAGVLDARLRWREPAA